MEKDNPEEFLLFGLEHFEIEVVNHKDNMIYLRMDYVIEIESNHLYKLLQDGQVIAPFNDVEELCRFIKMDMQLNEES
ncbi:MAG: hypothetical protein AAF573_00130 [Bacteroidota bacterium]